MPAEEKVIHKGLRELDRHILKVTRGRNRLDPDGRCRLRYERVSVHIRAIPQQDLVIFKSFINFVPDPNTGMVLPLYYHLLDKSDHPETGDAYFTIAASEEIGTERDAISLESRRPLTDMSFEEFRRCLSSVALASDRYIVKLRDEFQAPPIP